MRRLPKELRKALDAVGVPWALEQGSRHLHLRLNGRLIGILPTTGGHDNGRALKNVVAQVRRTAQGKGHHG